MVPLEILVSPYVMPPFPSLVLRHLSAGREDPWEPAGGRLVPGSAGVTALSDVDSPSLTHLPVSLRDGIFASGKEALHVSPAEDRAN